MKDEQSPIPPRLLSVPQAAQFLGRSPGALRMMIHRGQVPVVRLAGQRRVQIDVADLNQLIAAAKSTETS